MELTEMGGKNKNLAVNLVIILLAGIIAFNFIYKKQDKQLQGLNAKKELETKKNAVLANISILEKKVESFKKLLPAKDAGIVINSIGNIAREMGVKIASIRPAGEQKTQDYLKASYDVNVTCPTYHALGKFVSRLESYQDTYIVDSVSISYQDQTKEIIANLKVSTIAVMEK